ncbi:CHAT domain-containing protein [Thauera sp. 28]|uniref:CHAT domain-containing protein n=1 Tax=Thauera sp. 28 TaxID=303682 RepID=UPI0018DEDF6D|nr:CHAT domain-containing protein [Thauera sp. 28]
MRLPLISDWYQPHLNSATSALVAVVFLCAYALLFRESEKAKRAWLLRVVSVFIGSFVVCLLTPVLLSQGWEIPTLIVDLINLMHVLLYVVLFSAFSVGLMIAFLLSASVYRKSKKFDKPAENDTENAHSERRILVLFLGANPKDTSRLRLDEEVRSIDEALRMASQRDKLEIVQHWAVRVSDLQSCLLRYSPDILHFSGHASAANGILIEDQSGNGRPVSTDALRKLFSIFKGKVRCIVLNACYSEQQARAIAQEIDCVIGNSEAIEDQAAITFAAGFYEAIGHGKDIHTAYELGCSRLQMEWPSERTTPKLIAVNVDPKDVLLVPKPKAT